MNTGIEKYVPTFKSSASAWILYHKKLDNIFTRKEANAIWIKTWKNTGGDANRLANTADLRTAMSKKGITVEAATIVENLNDKVENFKRIMKISLIVFSCIVLVIIASKIYGNLKSE